MQSKTLQTLFPLALLLLLSLFTITTLAQQSIDSDQVTLLLPPGCLTDCVGNNTAVCDGKDQSDADIVKCGCTNKKFLEPVGKCIAANCTKQEDRFNATDYLAATCLASGQLLDPITFAGYVSGGLRTLPSVGMAVLLGAGVYYFS